MGPVVLIQPPLRDFYHTAKRTQPYGLACIAATLEAAGMTAVIVDGLATDRARTLTWPRELGHLAPHYGRRDLSPFGLFHRYRRYGYSIDHLAERVRRLDPFLVGISSLFSAYSEDALEMARAVKRRLPGCPIVMGGHHPTALPEAVMACTAVDYVLRGEGETGMVPLVRALQRGTDPGVVPGLVRRAPGGAVCIRPPAALPRLDGLPLPADHLIERRYYARRGRATKVVVGSRGCPLACSYCAVGRRAALGYRRRPVTDVVAELARAIERDGAGMVDFEDENISLERDWFLDLLERVTHRFGSRGIELRAMNGLYPPSLDATVIAAMATAGFRVLNLALATTAPEQLKRFGRPDVRRDLERVLVQARRRDLTAVVYLIVGAPGQYAADSLADLVYLAGLPALAGVSVYYPAPGSADYTRCRDHGLLPWHAARMASSALPLSHSTSRLEAATLLRLGRLLNFAKAILDRGRPLPPPAPLAPGERVPVADRRRLGERLLAAFRHDGHLAGAGPDGIVFRHPGARRLCLGFNDALTRGPVRGSAAGHLVTARTADL